MKWGVIKNKIVIMWSWSRTDCWLSLASTHCVWHYPRALAFVFFQRSIIWFFFFFAVVIVSFFILWRSIDRVRKLLSRCVISIVRTQSDCSYVMPNRWFAFPLAYGELWSLIVFFNRLKFACFIKFRPFGKYTQGPKVILQNGRHEHNLWPVTLIPNESWIL